MVIIPKAWGNYMNQYAFTFFYESFSDLVSCLTNLDNDLKGIYDNINLKDKYGSIADDLSRSGEIITRLNAIKSKDKNFWGYPELKQMIDLLHACPCYFIDRVTTGYAHLKDNARTIKKRMSEEYVSLKFLIIRNFSSNTINSYQDYCKTMPIKRLKLGQIGVDANIVREYLLPYMNLENYQNLRHLNRNSYFESIPYIPMVRNSKIHVSHSYREFIPEHKIAIYLNYVIGIGDENSNICNYRPYSENLSNVGLCREIFLEKKILDKARISHMKQGVVDGEIRLIALLSTDNYLGFSYLVSIDPREQKSDIKLLCALQNQFVCDILPMADRCVLMILEGGRIGLWKEGEFSVLEINIARLYPYITRINEHTFAIVDRNKRCIAVYNLEKPKERIGLYPIGAPQQSYIIVTASDSGDLIAITSQGSVDLWCRERSNKYTCSCIYKFNPPTKNVQISIDWITPSCVAWCYEDGNCLNILNFSNRQKPLLQKHYYEEKSICSRVSIAITSSGYIVINGFRKYSEMAYDQDSDEDDSNFPTAFIRVWKVLFSESIDSYHAD